MGRQENRPGEKPLILREKMEKKPDRGKFGSVEPNKSVKLVPNAWQASTKANKENEKRYTDASETSLGCSTSVNRVNRLGHATNATLRLD